MSYSILQINEAIKARNYDPIFDDEDFGAEPQLQTEYAVLVEVIQNTRMLLERAIADNDAESVTRLRSRLADYEKKLDRWKGRNNDGASKTVHSARARASKGSILKSLGIGGKGISHDDTLSDHDYAEKKRKEARDYVAKKESEFNKGLKSSFGPKRPSDPTKGANWHGSVGKSEPSSKGSVLSRAAGTVRKWFGSKKTAAAAPAAEPPRSADAIRGKKISMQDYNAKVNPSVKSSSDKATDDHTDMALAATERNRQRSPGQFATAALAARQNKPRPVRENFILLDEFLMLAERAPEATPSVSRLPRSRGKQSVTELEYHLTGLTADRKGLKRGSPERKAASKEVRKVDARLRRLRASEKRHKANAAERRWAHRRANKSGQVFKENAEA